MTEYETMLMQAILEGDTHKFYKSKLWLAKRKEILKRDHYECQRCVGKHDQGQPIKHVKLTRAKYVHHIVELRDDPTRMLDSNNLVSLCFECHEIMHKRAMKIQTKKRLELADERW